MITAVAENSEWLGLTHHFTVLARKQIGPGADDVKLKEWDGYITTMEAADGRLIAIDIRVAKAGSKLSGTLDGYGKVFTSALAGGAIVSDLCQPMIASHFEPYGATKNPEIPRCTSLLDYLSRWIASRYAGAWYVKRYGAIGGE